ncbi:MAG TPA: DUF1232 domain-containing protein [Polyangia bacterium]
MANFAAGARFFRRWLARKPHSGERLAASPLAALRTLERAMAKAGRIGGFRGVLGDLLSLGRLVKAWVRRDYRQVSRGTIVLSLAALAYFLAPIDAILDAIPFAGFVDDAAVLAWVLREIRQELAAFRLWEVAHQEATALSAADPAAAMLEGVGSP